MKIEDFEKVLEETIIHIKAVLCRKGVEYTHGKDRLSMFKLAAAFCRCTPEKALLGMLSKHLVSVWDLVGDIGDGKIASADFLDEKIGDCINYLILLRALIKERSFSNSQAALLETSIVHPHFE